MDTTEQAHFDASYTRHLRNLKLRGMRNATIDNYSRAVRRVSAHFACSPDHLTTEQLEKYFATLIESYSWSTVKVVSTINQLLNALDLSRREPS